MTMTRIVVRMMWIFVAALLLPACAAYKQQVVPFKLPSAYPNVTEVADAQIAAQAYEDEKNAEAAFGFDIRGAEILPVKVIFDNRGRHSLEIVASQTFLVDTENNLWPILDQTIAYDRIARITAWSNVAPEGAKTAFLGAMVGVIIGAAVGIVSGGSVGEALGKGAAIGAAAGATVGGAKALSDHDVEIRVRDDLEARSLQSRPIPPQQVAHGFLFFPGEAKTIRELRLQIRALDTGVIYPLTLRF